MIKRSGVNACGAWGMGKSVRRCMYNGLGECFIMCFGFTITLTSLHSAIIKWRVSINDETKMPYILIDLNKQVFLEVRMIKSMHPVNR
jgi:hypothetical protein